MSQAIGSLLCAPITLPARVIGALYLDTRGAAFDEDDFHLVTAIANVAAAPLDQARRAEWLERELARLREESAGEREMIGESAVMRKLYDLIERVAPASTTVLIRGESGTGKELAARALHAGSPRAEQPFVAINCAALTESLLESELFGHERGAFTGAIARKIGKIEAAEGGTVFLDEIGEMPPALQVKLLRVLQERELERVGGIRPIPVDIRVIAATNRDLEQAIHSGTFRQDLYYRLNVVTLTLPPLRERPEDIAALADHFCARFAKQLGRPVRGLAPEARAALTRHDWPGNVRELQNAIERAVLLCTDEWVRCEDLPELMVERPTAGNPADPIAGFHEAVAEAKRKIIQRALDEAGGIITDAARSLGLNPNYLHRLLNNLGMRSE